MINSNMDPDRALEALRGLGLPSVPDELIEEVGAVVVDHTRGTLLGMSPIGDRLREATGPQTAWRDFSASLGHALLQALQVAPGYAVTLHPAISYGEVRPWRDDGTGLPVDGPRVRYRRDGTTLCGVLVLACTLAEREGKPVPPPLLAAATRLLSGGYVEVLW